MTAAGRTLLLIAAIAGGWLLMADGAPDEESSIDAEPLVQKTAPVVAESQLHALHDVAPPTADDEISKQLRLAAGPAAAAAAADPSHRHSVAQLEPDPADTIFDAKSSGSRNPLQRTTTIPRERLNAGSAGGIPQSPPASRAKRQATPRSRDFASEYELINSDFSEDAAGDTVEKTVYLDFVAGEDSASPTTARPTETNGTELAAQDLSRVDDDAAEAAAIDLSFEADSQDSNEKSEDSDDSTLDAGNSLKGGDTHKQLQRKIQKEAGLAVTDALPTAPSDAPSQTPTADPAALFFDDNAPAATRVKRADNEDGAEAPVEPKSRNFVRIIHHAESNTTELFHPPTTPQPVAPSARQSTLRTADFEDISAPASGVNSGDVLERQNVERATATVVPRLVPADLIVSNDEELLKDLPQSAGAGADKSIGLEKEVDPAAPTVNFFDLFPPGRRPTTTTPRPALSNSAGAIGTRPGRPAQPQSGTSTPPQGSNTSSSGPQDTSARPSQPLQPQAVQLNHFRVGGRRFVIKSVPYEQFIQQQQQQFVLPPQQQQQFPPLPQGSAPFPQVPTRQQPAQFLAPSLIQPLPQPIQAQPQFFSRQRAQANGDIPAAAAATARPAVRVIQTAAPRTTTRLLDIISTNRPAASSHVKSDGGELYDEVLSLDTAKDTPQRTIE